MATISHHTATKEWVNDQGFVADLSQPKAWLNPHSFTAVGSGLGGVTQSYVALKTAISASAGAQQVSPSVEWLGKGWKTNSVASSVDVSFQAYTLPEQGAAAPTGKWVLQSKIGSGSYADVLTVSDAGNMRQGAADSASPVSQHFSVQNVVAGTSNTAGAHRYYNGSQSTGNAVGGSHIFRTSAPGSSGTGQNSLSDHFKIFWESGFRKIQIGLYQFHETEGMYETGGSLSIGQYGFYGNKDYGYIWSNGSNQGNTRDLVIGRAATKALGIWGDTGRSTGGALEMTAMTAPSSPAASKVRLYADTDGGGRVRLMALFPSGAAQQVAIEP